MEPFVTVCVCTRNRAAQLRQFLDSISKCIYDKSDWEIVVVNNGSVDNTSEIINSYKNIIPIREVHQPVAGLSNARNKGVFEARGKYICWTDDDVELDHNWLSSYVNSFLEHPEYSVFGGVVSPILLGYTPIWFSENRRLLGDLLAEREFGPEPMELSLDNLPYGANYAVRTIEQRRHPYDPNLGVAPHQKRLGEETSVVEAILRDGGKGISVPQAKVFHLIPQERQSLAYVHTYQQSAGETWMYLQSREAAQNGEKVKLEKPLWSGVPRWLWRDMIKNRALFHWYRLIGPSHKWLRHWMEYSYLSGRVKFIRRNKELNL